MTGGDLAQQLAHEMVTQKFLGEPSVQKALEAEDF